MLQYNSPSLRFHGNDRTICRGCDGRALFQQKLQEMSMLNINLLRYLTLRHNIRIERKEIARIQKHYEFFELFYNEGKKGIKEKEHKQLLKELKKTIKQMYKDAHKCIMCIGRIFINTSFLIQKIIGILINEIKADFQNVGPENYILVGESDVAGYSNFETWLENQPETVADVNVEGKDTWILLYTSGTTGVPKGVVRSHESYISFFLLNAVDYRFTEFDYALIIMPFYHVNTTFYAFTFTYIGGGVYIHRARDFNPEELLQIVRKRSSPNGDEGGGQSGCLC